MTAEEWEAIDWAKVGKKKAIFLYQEAAKYETVSYLNRSETFGTVLTH